MMLNAKEKSRARMTSSTSANPTGLVLLVSSTMITNSSNFWVVIATWVTQLYRDLVGCGGHPADTWKLMCQSLQKIFQELYNAREAGRGRIDLGDKPAAMVWGCLQGYRRVMKFLEHSIGQDPVLFHILNKHLQDKAAIRQLRKWTNWWRRWMMTGGKLIILSRVSRKPMNQARRRESEQDL
mmetsp:Transcript_4997/g.7673  ORF Transcript_4997/g.7673 Transcript_4997/m.7673 type:complete len:182 (+) Transcript_4997:781-1326(+)